MLSPARTTDFVQSGRYTGILFFLGNVHILQELGHIAIQRLPRDFIYLVY
jgi:hypothetical protein